MIPKKIMWTDHYSKLNDNQLFPRTCCGVSFCSVECRDIASESYHR